MPPSANGTDVPVVARLPVLLLPEPLPAGATVLVIESRGTRQVDVSAWHDPVDL